MTPPASLRSSEVYDPRRRITVLLAVMVVLALLLGWKLLTVQVLDPDRYVAFGEDQRLQTIPLEGRRGQLLDRNGEELAVSLPRPVIAADPQLIDDAALAAQALAPVLQRDPADISELLTTPGRFVYLQRPSDDATAEAIRDLQLPGVFIDEEPRRFRPAGNALARGVLGAVGVDNEGLSGIELGWHETLAGTPGRLVAERSVDGRTIPDGDRELVPALHGEDVHLTIDSALQFEVERALTDQVLATGARGGVVIIVEPATGDVLAMASVATTEDGSVVTTSDNRAVTWTYEPASVMKAMTFASVIEAGVATPNSSRIVDDELQLYKETFTDDERYDSQEMTVTDILVRSSNTGTIAWAQDLGARGIYDEFTDFGFGSSTGLGFPGESAGLFTDVDEWSGTDIATIAIGQSVAVTPLQMVTAFSVLANDGVYVEPRLVVGTTSLDGTFIEAEASDTHRVVSASTANQVTDMLVRVVDGGTAKRAKVHGYSVAAKTGTARKVQEGGGYVDAAGNFHYVATVTGFFPAENPQFAMITIIDEPSTEIYASRVAAPLFGQLATWTLRHYRVSPATEMIVETDLESLDVVVADGEQAAGPEADD